MSDARIILALNGGSSSLKYALFQSEKALDRGSVEQIKNDASATLKSLLDLLHLKGCPKPQAVGHRLVHGGPHHFDPVQLDSKVLQTLKDAIPFAPLHLPGELELIQAVTARLPDTPQVACFDTGFHHHLPEVAQRFAIPEKFFAGGIRKYGFHGLSYAFVVEALGAKTLGRAVLAHLGSGASLAAVHEGKSQDTTMGFTPTAGLVMSTRSGDLDPGVLIYLLQHEGLDAKALEKLLDHQSGLLALSQTTGDVKQLLQNRKSDPRAALALEIFCYSIAKHIGAMTAVLGGIDSLVFTGGVGAHSSEIRGEVCSRLGHLGIALEKSENEKGSAIVGREESRCTVHVVQTDEERMIARGVTAALAAKA